VTLAFVDSHTHLADPAFDADREDTIARARAAGAVALVCIGESLDAADRARAMAAEHPDMVYWTAGVHPHDAAAFNAARDIPAIRERLAAGAVAVGECGLDYHYDHSPRDQQMHAFSEQLALARETDKPAVVHTRDAVADTRDLVQEAGGAGARGVLHCFTGPADLARAALDVGWFVSFSGMITFAKWAELDLLRLVPDDRLLVESDAQYLAPVPHRGKRNEPAWVSHTIRRLAEVRGVDAERLGRQAATNASHLFGLPAP
jgi:TatD DNase family protein